MVIEKKITIGCEYCNIVSWFVDQFLRIGTGI